MGKRFFVFFFVVLLDIYSAGYSTISIGKMKLLVSLPYRNLRYTIRNPIE